MCHAGSSQRIVSCNFVAFLRSHADQIARKSDTPHIARETRIRAVDPAPRSPARVSQCVLARDLLANLWWHTNVIIGASFTPYVS